MQPLDDIQVDIEVLADTALKGLSSSRQSRYLIGITGPPGAGKSTLMEALVRTCAERLGAGQVLGLPMDGFHMTNAKLTELGLHSRKGAPETFDSDVFVSALRQLANHDQEMGWPTYSRKLNDPVQDAIEITSDTRLIFIEGNYLLLPVSPWDQVRGFLNTVWYVHADKERLERRLIRRQVESGRARDEAVRHVRESDMSNVEQVSQTEKLADRLILIGAEDPLLSGLIDPATGQPIRLDR